MWDSELTWLFFHCDSDEEHTQGKRNNWKESIGEKWYLTKMENKIICTFIVHSYQYSHCVRMKSHNGSWSAELEGQSNGSSQWPARSRKKP